MKNPPVHMISKREILKNVTQRVSARKVAFKNDTQKPNTDTPAINLIKMNTRVLLKRLFDEILNSILFFLINF